MVLFQTDATEAVRVGIPTHLEHLLVAMAVFLPIKLGHHHVEPKN